MRKQLLSLLRKFSKSTIAVIGDLIADEFLYGEVARISREAPVLVLDCRNLVRSPGGAANAANNLLALGAGVTIAGAVGQDEAGKDILASLRRSGADTRAIRRLRAYSTPIKTRILAGARHAAPHQIVRIDRSGNREVPLRLSRNVLEKIIQTADGIILSDYGYNAISPSLRSDLCRIADTKGIPIVADSRFRMSDYTDITAVTPNITELEACTGISIGSDTKLLHKVAGDALDRQRLQCLLVTQGRFGMTLFEAHRPPLHIPIYGTDEVADVTGAGDTVIAVFTLALACGASPAQAARLANYAGGIVVMKQGTATVSRAELRDALK
ncbi:MAG: PfkB family carbohydrate kinase [Acidobacteriota bacterium]|jgi:rfaE bifunctional protein kinase chain/domain